MGVGRVLGRPMALGGVGVALRDALMAFSSLINHNKLVVLFK